MVGPAGVAMTGHNFGPGPAETVPFCACDPDAAFADAAED